MPEPQGFDVEDGMVSVLTGAALDIEIDKDLVRSASANAPAWQNPVNFSLFLILNEDMLHIPMTGMARA
jgi:hypothetical protein